MNAQDSILIIIVTHVRATEIYVVIVEAPRKKEKHDEI
jgi:hypothetical protein